MGKEIEKQYIVIVLIVILITVVIQIYSQSRYRHCLKTCEGFYSSSDFEWCQTQCHLDAFGDPIYWP